VRNTLAIAGKEFKSYLTSPMAYVVTSIFLVATGFLFGYNPLTYSETSIIGMLQGFGPISAPTLLILFASLLTMRLLSEEKKLGTIELLLTAPVRDTEVIVGKFLGSFYMMMIMLALTFYYPILLGPIHIGSLHIGFGDPDIGPIITSYVGLFLLGTTSLAVGIFGSSVTSNQIVAAVVSGAILFGLWFLEFFATALPQAVGNVIGFFSLSHYFSDFSGGIIDTRAIVYYLSITVLFIFLAIRSLENSRWT
jgi:ABC-2 type transport system permease protein